eukprot:CAMPEP_0119469770 /NCGR_PEP_ID=MMETSP1344-20130328/2954_1 /TAXON_ID=236787 /ORGANISM="Florenciella parvula, Strain CCMP2471" /LENGTH=86 /DNA_ID=CAMNT_0007502363 /DNA_START=225 /DNA_END=481 /DNA_ORIENTATION=-
MAVRDPGISGDGARLYTGSNGARVGGAADQEQDASQGLELPKGGLRREPPHDPSDRASAEHARRRDSPHVQRAARACLAIVERHGR